MGSMAFPWISMSFPRENHKEFLQEMFHAYFPVKTKSAAIIRQRLGWFGFVNWTHERVMVAGRTCCK